MANLIKGTRFAAQECLYEHGCPLHATWRWGTIHGILEKILKVKNSLRLVWNTAKFMESSAGRAQREFNAQDKDVLNLNVLSKCIRNPRWWAYTKMLNLLHGVQHDASVWSESCPCHSWLKPIERESRAVAGLANCRNMYDEPAIKLHNCRLTLGLEDRSKDRVDGIRHRPCPLAGMRAPELATGALKAAFETHRGPAMEALLENCDGATPEEIADILDDFTLGTARILEVINVKTAHWQEFPWKLCALAHWDHEIAVASAEQAIAEFDRSAQTPAAHHRITWNWLNADSPLRAMLLSFIGGTCISDLPLLHEKIAELRFIPTAERRQEGDHSLVTRGAAPKVTGPYVSLLLRRGEIEDLCSTTEGHNRYCELLQGAMNSSSIAKRLSLDKHPMWTEAKTRKANHRERLKMLASILYSLDSEAQYMKMTKTRKRRRAHAKAHEPPTKKPKAFSMAAIQEAALVDHLQQALVPGYWYP